MVVGDLPCQEIESFMSCDIVILYASLCQHKHVTTCLGHKGEYGGQPFLNDDMSFSWHLPTLTSHFLWLLLNEEWYTLRVTS